MSTNAPPRSPSPWRPNRLLVALLAGLAAGIALSVIGGAVLATTVHVVEPIGALWVNAIRMTVVPLVVSLLITSVASTARASTVGKLGGASLVTFIAIVVLAALFAIVVAPLLFQWLSISSESAAALRGTVARGASGTAREIQALPSFSEWLTSLVPANPVRAAADGAMLPLVVFSVAFALAVLQLPEERRDAVVRFFGGVADAMLVLVRWVIAVAPIGIFALILPPAARLGVTIAGAIGYYVIAMAVALVGFTLLLYPVTAIVAQIPLKRFARGALPPQAVAFSSSSSLASLPALIEGAERELGYTAEVCGFVLPLAVATFKAVTPISWTVAALFIAKLYGVELHLPQLMTIALAGVALGFSIPGVPNAAFLLIAPLFVNIGLPPEGVGLLIAADAIPDLFGTMANVTGDLAACAIVASRARP